MAQNGNAKAHEGTYNGFVRLFKVGTILTVLVTALVVFLIAT